MKNIPAQFSSHAIDLAAMQRATEAVCSSIETQVKAAMQSGILDEKLLKSSLYALAHTSARAQEEYAELKGDDESQPGTWTAVALSE